MTRYTVPDMMCGILPSLQPRRKKYCDRPVARLAAGIFWKGVAVSTFTVFICVCVLSYNLQQLVDNEVKL